jgi:small conductance mechanosensitive channel
MIRRLVADLSLVIPRWLPFLFALAAAALVLGAARWLLFVRKSGRLGRRTLTRQLAMLALTALALVVLILALPIGDAARGQLFSLIGLVLTGVIALSSTTFVGNAMAGLMLRAVHAFRAGDFLRTREYFGRVAERGLLHTEIQTEDRDLTTLPNLFLVTNPVTVVRYSGTFVSATVSLGYDVPRTQVEEALLDAARAAELEDPFVQILELGDFSVQYRVAGFLREVKLLLSARSRLRASMLDRLHAAGIEIVSPTFMNQRQVPRDRRFIPPKPRGAAAEDEDHPVPEAIIFDKADQAESRERLNEELGRIVEAIEAVRKEEGGSAGASEVGQGRLQALEARRERLVQAIARFDEEAATVPAAGR